MLFYPFTRCWRHLRVVVVLLISTLAVSAETVDITVLATADLHGEYLQMEKAVLPYVAGELAADQRGTIWVDVGDTLQGTWRANRSQGRNILRKLADGGCSIWVPGNHDMEYGLGVFKQQVRDFPGTVLAANLNVPDLDGEIKNFIIRELNGVKVAFIGMVVGHMHTYYPVAEKQFQILNPEKSLRQSIDRAKAAGAEVFVLLRHAGRHGGGINLDDLIRKTPEINLVIGAHTHLPEPGCRIGNAWYVQPPARGVKMVKATVVYDKEKHRVMQIYSELTELKKIPAAAEPELREPAPAFPGGDVNFPAQVMRKHCQSDLALYSANAAGLQNLAKKSAPRKQHYYQVFGFIDPIFCVKVTAEEFENILKEYLQKSHKRKYHVIGSGFTFRAEKGELQELQFDKKQPEYSLAISAFDIAGAGGQLLKVRKMLLDRVDLTQADAAVCILDLLFSYKQP